MTILLNAMVDHPRLRALRNFFMREAPGKTALSEVLPKIPKLLDSFEQTGDPYFDLSFFCATVLLETAANIPDTELSLINTIQRMASVVINWGIYAHLPKSIHLKFFDEEPQWFHLLSAPRFLRPRSEMLNSLFSLFESPVLSEFIHFFWLIQSRFSTFIPRTIPFTF
jgi:hypothetical protein